MKILGMGANPFNSRDGIIVEGCKSILNISKFDRYIFIDDHKPQPVHCFYPEEKFDLIVYCGTPYLWDGMFDTWKVVNTLDAIRVHPEAKVIWLGIGSSLYLGDENGTILRNSIDQRRLRETFKNSLVFVRDSLAHSILNEASVENHFLPCPSYFFNSVCETSKEYDVIFYHAPKTGISSGWWNEDRLDEYNNIFCQFYQRGGRNAQIVVCEPEEIKIARDLFWEHPKLITDPIDTFSVCKKARRVLSSRIHNAVPAMVYGAEVGIVPVDSRHHTITDHFDIKIENINDLSKIKKCDINKLTDKLDVYQKLIFEE